MPLKIRYAKQDDIPQEHRSLYSERNGSWSLDVDDAVPADELARERREREAATTRAAAMEADLVSARTEEAAVSAALLHGLKPSAAVDLRHRAKSELTLVDGKPAKKGLGGEAPTPIAINDWVAQQARDACHLFEAGTGTGAAGVRAKVKAHDGPNPWDAATENLTEQIRIERKDPELAAQLKASAKR